MFINYPYLMRFECECGTTLSKQAGRNGEIKATAECKNCGGRYATTISRLKPL